MFLLGFMHLATNVIGQGPAASPTLAQDLAKTFGFCYGQELSLSQLRGMFPDIEPQVMLAEMQWRISFGEAEKGVEARLRALGPEQWDDVKPKMIAQMEPILTKQNSLVPFLPGTQFATLDFARFDRREIDRANQLPCTRLPHLDLP